MPGAGRASVTPRQKATAMTLHRKAFKFRMVPTKAQEAWLIRQANACRWVWNWALARRKEHYALTGKNLGCTAQCKELTRVKQLEVNSWLRDAILMSLQQTLRDLDRSFSRFFAKNANYPKFKSKKRDLPRFRCLRGPEAGAANVSVTGGYVRIPKLGRVKIRQSQNVDLPIRAVTIKRDAAGRWFAVLLTEFELPPITGPGPDNAGFIGIDLGLKEFAVLSDGVRIESPRFFQKSQTKLARAQRTLRRRKVGSKRREKAKARVARIHATTGDRRANFIHNLTSQLVNNYSGFALEDLCVKGLAKTKLAKSVRDAGWGEFRRQLTYKSAWNRKQLVIVDRWFASSKTCQVCKGVNDALTLGQRSWTCGCGAVLDRDLNAAGNIRDEGLKFLAGVHTER